LKIEPEFQELKLNGKILEDKNNEDALKDLKSYSKIELIKNTKTKEDLKNDVNDFKEIHKKKRKEK